MPVRGKADLRSSASDYSDDSRGRIHTQDTEIPEIAHKEIARPIDGNRIRSAKKKLVAAGSAIRPLARCLRVAEHGRRFGRNRINPHDAVCTGIGYEQCAVRPDCHSDWSIEAKCRGRRSVDTYLGFPDPDKGSDHGALGVNSPHPIRPRRRKIHVSRRVYGHVAIRGEVRVLRIGPEHRQICLDCKRPVTKRGR